MWMYLTNFLKLKNKYVNTKNVEHHGDFDTTWPLLLHVNYIKIRNIICYAQSALLSVHFKE